jgi:hypothetical protein
VPTPISSSDPYIAVADFLKRYDWRTIAQLMGDDDQVEPLRSTLLDDETTEGANLAEVLKDSSGEVETAALVGGRYAPADLNALTGNQLAYLKRLVADIAIGRCYQRRPDLFGPPPTQAQVAAQVLNAIASGERVFGLQENIDASHLDMTTDTPDQVHTRYGVVRQAAPYFGRRVNMNLPNGDR